MRSLIRKKSTALIIKIGGSVLDAEFESSHAVVRQLINPLKKLFKDFNVFITLGGGPSWDVRKQWQKRYGTPAHSFKKIAELNLLLNAMELAVAFGDIATICPPQDFKPESFVAEAGIDHIQICYWPPSRLISKHALATLSDLQTLVMAEDLAQAYDHVNVIFLKRTPGVFHYDPRLNSLKIEHIITNKCSTSKSQQAYMQLLMRIKRDEKNGFPIQQKHLPIVKTSELLSGDISRLGEDGDDDHLIERPAVEFLHDATHKVKQVGIIHYEQTQYIHEMIESPNANSPYSLIIRG